MSKRLERAYLIVMLTFHFNEQEVRMFVNRKSVT